MAAYQDPTPRPKPADGAMMMAELPDHERPRERLVQRGAEALSDAELLAIVLRNGPPGQSVLDLSRRVLNAFDGSLNKLAVASVPQLQEIRGIGPAKAVEIRAAFALAHRLSTLKETDCPRLTEPEAVYTLLKERFRNAEREEFNALLLDAKNQLLRIERVTVGLVDRTQIHPREVFRAAISEACSRILLVHNHPSGDPTPSAQDIAATRQLADAGKVVGIDILDHVIIANPARTQEVPFVSFRREKLL